MTYEIGLTEDEQKYFETGGKHTPETVEEQDNEQSGQDVQRDASSESVETSSDGRDESDKTEHTEAEDGGNESSDEDGRDRQASDEESSKRDFRQAYDSERHKRAELKKQYEEMAKKNAEYEQHLKKIAEKLTATQAAEPSQNIPDPNEDPLGYAQYKIDSLSKSVEEQQRYMQAQRQQQEYSQHYNQFVNTYANSAKEFSRSEPDFNDAYRHLMNSRLQEYKAAGYSEAEASNIIQQEEMQIVAKAYQDGINPAERLYQLAKVKGYAKQTANNNNSKLKNVEKGIKRSKSLGSSTSGHEKDSFDINQIDDLSFDEFDKFWEKKVKGK